MTVPEEVPVQKDLHRSWLAAGLGGTEGCLVARETKGSKTNSLRRKAKKKRRKRQ
ncbi:hypothetical protein WN55_08387 [Dufourea novaeangliae]|uniref:Uncharacterized protein n=1 Tax=Dufourea novaeangliae TaxID=178035 RepID=A0A154P6Q0_DUFNO|nr:hypothetical protein WN55_08387 [Dufourea novaeangliae]